MAYFRSLPNLRKMLDLFSRDMRWLILINADPDAMASAMALKRIMSHRVQDAVIAKVNTITRPDNLAMVRYTRLHMERFYPGILPHFDRFALVDSQPDHHPAFKDVPFSIVIDHHPLPEKPLAADYSVIKPEYGATSTLLTEYLYNLGIRPGKLLATALQFGIKTDTANFGRHFCDIDLRAYHYLNRFSDHALLSRIARSEFHLHWLKLFARACTNLYAMGSSGQYVFIGVVDNPDILVNIADFFMRVFEIRWAAVAGLYGETVVVIFRGDGVSRDVGTYANQVFHEFGSAGGHKAMARAEFPVSAADGEDLELFIWRHLLQAPRNGKKNGNTRNSGRVEENAPQTDAPAPPASEDENAESAEAGDL